MTGCKGQSRRALTLLAAVAVLLSACGDSGEASGPLPTVDALLESTAAAMQAASAVGYEMSPTGGAVFFDEGLGLEFNSATGSYSAPDSAISNLNLKVAGAVFEVESIAIGDTVWVTEPLTESWNELRAGTGFNPAILFDPELGVGPLLTEDMSNPKIVGVESGNYRVTGSVSGSRVEAITFGLAGGQTIDLDLLIDVDTSLIAAAEFTTSGSEGTTDWRIDFRDYDEPVTIEPPVPG